MKKGDTAYYVNLSGEIKEIILQEEVCRADIYVKFQGGRILQVPAIRLFRTIPSAQTAALYYSTLGHRYNAY
jgi:hypothetical protein